MPQIYGNGESCFQFVARSCRKNEWKWCFQFMTFHLVVYVQRHSDCGCNVHSFSLTPKIVLICFHYLYQTAWKFKKVHHPQVFSCHIFQGHFPTAISPMAMSPYDRGPSSSGRRRRPGRQRGLLPPRGQAHGQGRDNSASAAERCGSSALGMIHRMIHMEYIYI